MKNLLLYFFIFCLIQFSYAQPGEWVWLHGSNNVNNPGTFGVQGVSDPANVPPALYEACEWTDQNGNFWFFSGLNFTYDEFSDVWKYDPAINEWTWMKGPGFPNFAGNYGTIGIASPMNIPPARSWGVASWVDQQGNFWMLGGMTGGGVFADLWRFEPATNNWTWMKGPQGLGNNGVYGTQGVGDPTNFPGGRYETAATWTDNSGNLWLFGGSDFGAFRNDLWKYNISANEWTWMKGSQFTGAGDVYGTIGVEDPANTPGGRAVYAHWKDLNGNFWLFGGTNFSGAITYNDLWRYNPATNNWTWFKGGTTTGVYGTRCIPDSLNTPGRRMENRATITDLNGNFWLFGGGEGSSFQDVYNDLWMYCTSINQWVWIDGEDFSNPPGNWGTLGVSSPLNEPNGRGGALMWYDQNGHLYIFGGTNSGWPNMYNDMWKYTIDPACTPCSVQPQALFSAPNNICPGTCTDFTNASINSTTFLWSFPGGNPNASTDLNPTNICYNSPGNYDVTLIASNGATSDTITLPNYINVYPTPPPQGILQNGDTLFANAGAVSYQWYYDGNAIPGATDYFYVAPQGGNFNVVAIDSNGCEVEAVIFDVIAGISQIAVSKWQLAIYPNPVKDVLEIINPVPGTKLMLTVYNDIGKKMMRKEFDHSSKNISLNVSALAAGIYYLEVKNKNTSLRKVFTKQ